MSRNVTAAAPPMPVLDGPTVVTALLAGVAADVTWEVWARLLTPLWVGGPLEPAALVQSVFGLQSRLAGRDHPSGRRLRRSIRWAICSSPGRSRALVVPWAPWWLVALGYGVGLWIFALYVMAHLIAGLPAFLGFIPLTWASLVGHLLFALVLAWVVRWRERGTRLAR